MPRRSLVRISLAALLAVYALPLLAVDFRIDTQVFVDDERKPAFSNVTLFQRGVVYDFLNDPATEITIYDPRGRHFTLLDVERQVKTRIQQDVLLQFVAQVKARAVERGGPTVREAASPKFQVEYDARAGLLSLVGKRMNYQVQEAADRFPSPEAARDYFQFVDLYTQLNATRTPMPPQARMELNRAVAEHNILPATITRTVRSGNPLFSKPAIARSEHSVVWRLLREDQAMIDRAAGHRANFTAVSFGEYRELPEPR